MLYSNYFYDDYDRYSRKFFYVINDSYNYISEDLLPDAALYSFKNLSGDYRTASAFATWLSAHILNKTMTDLSSITLRKGKIEKQQKNILIYNHFDAIQHSFILLSK